MQNHARTSSRVKNLSNVNYETIKVLNHAMLNNVIYVVFEICLIQENKVILKKILIFSQSSVQFQQYSNCYVEIGYCALFCTCYYHRAGKCGKYIRLVCCSFTKPSYMVTKSFILSLFQYFIIQEFSVSKCVGRKRTQSHHFIS